jgi:hypothetical protein
MVKKESTSLIALSQQQIHLLRRFFRPILLICHHSRRGTILRMKKLA